MNNQPTCGVKAGEPEILGTRCMDGGACHHRCVRECYRKGHCVPLRLSGLTQEEFNTGYCRMEDPQDPAPRREYLRIDTMTADPEGRYPVMGRRTPVSEEYRDYLRVRIKALFLFAGFTIKDGLTDLKEYVYVAGERMTHFYQEAVHHWMLRCFGEEITADKKVRSHRFLEEALELAQASECTEGEAQELVRYVFGRPVGEVRQEIGGVSVTLNALCVAHGISRAEAEELELNRCWDNIEKIRTKSANKPKFSALPQTVPEGFWSVYRERTIDWSQHKEAQTLLFPTLARAEAFLQAQSTSLTAGWTYGRPTPGTWADNPSGTLPLI